MYFTTPTVTCDGAYQEVCLSFEKKLNTLSSALIIFLQKPIINPFSREFLPDLSNYTALAQTAAEIVSGRKEKLTFATGDAVTTEKFFLKIKDFVENALNLSCIQIDGRRHKDVYEITFSKTKG